METNLMFTQYLPTLTYWHWYGMAVVLMILEFLLMTSGFLFWLALAAAVVGLFLWFFPFFVWPYQILVFSLGGIVSSVVWWSYLLRHRPVRAKNKRGEQYKYRVFILERAIISGQGTLLIESNLWHIIGPNLPAGTKVRVIGSEGISLRVEKAE